MKTKENEEKRKEESNIVAQNTSQEMGYILKTKYWKTELENFRFQILIQIRNAVGVVILSEHYVFS